MSTHVAKYPLGIKPRSQLDAERVGEIIDAGCRYAHADHPMPVDWLHELQELFERKYGPTHVVFPATPDRDDREGRDTPHPNQDVQDVPGRVQRIRNGTRVVASEGTRGEVVGYSGHAGAGWYAVKVDGAGIEPFREHDLTIEPAKQLGRHVVINHRHPDQHLCGHRGIVVDQDGDDLHVQMALPCRVKAVIVHVGLVVFCEDPPHVVPGS